MSNNLVSQPLSIPSTQMATLEAIPNRVESSMRDVQMGFPGIVPDESASQPSLLRQQSRNAGAMSLFENDTGYLEGRENFLVPQRSSMPMEDMGSKLSNQAVQQLPMLNKRKAPMAPMPSSPSPRSIMAPNKRAAQVDHRPWLQQSAPNRKGMPGQSIPTSGVKHLPAANKKLGPVESISPRSVPQRLSVPKNQMSNVQPSPKVQSDSFGSVRSKMRESLAAALALVSHEEGRSPTGKDSENRDLSAPSSRVDAQPAPIPGDAVDNVHEVQERKRTSCDGFGIHHNSPIVSQEAFATKHSGDSNMHSISNVQDLQSGSVLIQEDLPFGDNFFVKDELLQGNGLSWVLDSDTNVGERRGNQDGEMKEKVHDELNGRSAMAFQSPEVLASSIEAELFKLFGGVNKKYKEKGRSLLFNLKDRSNPELRERVVSGEIPPERLCSMTAEELASKELSEWRMAKAEELAQMVVLPDSEVDMKRLVKKTHKGEFQVEVEQYDVSVEVSSGVSSGTRDRKKADDQEFPVKKPGERDENMKAGDRKSDLAVQGAAYTLTIPTEDDASDVDIMEENVTKDLPPIVSLDEFMECLESEPPFKDLHEGAGKSEPASEKDLKIRSPEESLNDSADMAEKKSVEIFQPASEKDLKAKSPERSLNNTTDMTEEKSSKVDETLSPADVDIGSSDHHGKYDSKDPTVASKGEPIWEGSLLLITTMISVIGFFKSGEKTPSKDWSSSLEIKGRVRLDAFEKFLQDLRMSRSRAIMVVHFICKEESSESERASLCEVADSYVLDERVGFAEPSQGVELYLCPPHAKIREMLSKILPEDQLNVLSDVENGLIGVVVWRRSHLTSAIPSHTAKFTGKKQHFSSRRHQEKDVNFNSNLHQGHLAHPSSMQPQPSVDRDDDDDVPPGFGPGVGRAARDEDDLPEFNFSGGSRSMGLNPTQNVSAGLGLAPSYGHSRAPPVDHIRELIHKYGHTGVGVPSENYGVPVQPWNDDDDDIPEWNPQGLYNLQQTSRGRPDVRLASAQQSQSPSAYLTREPLARNAQRPASGLHGGHVYVAPQARPPGRRQDARRDRGF
ncbi:uncharacterized protein LOC115743459 [Rhodamnia argentea]|uniref:Uncharacterized protein LOC115743459 n=1 Tax=Rhodamnia argentea TaxID=178133 RepID=A0A8B8PI27_9MYRT|nr:uncharacterized protein LOC115743459 [Rhodamnia argentea]